MPSMKQAEYSIQDVSVGYPVWDEITNEILVLWPGFEPLLLLPILSMS